MGSSASALTFDRPSAADVTSAVAVERIPWYVWCLAAAVCCDAFGGYWDISWHISIGRDTFWTPAHMVVYLAGVLSGISCGYAILSTTLGGEAAKRDAVTIWGFSGPLGCFIATWGAFAMLTSAPFDNWWHNAYGLDVKIVSLPHSILAGGELMITLGATLLLCAQVNRASGQYRERLDKLLLAIGGIWVLGSATFMLESTPIQFMHSVTFYRAVATGFPLSLISISMVSKSKWPMTTMAAIYSMLYLAFLWIFPLFPATPKLGPVYQHIIHMVPLWFPTLVIFPAIALDLLRARLGELWGSWWGSAVAGVVFLAVFLAVQWPWADFMMTPLARNPIFGADYFPYNSPAGLLWDPYKFFDPLHLKGAAFAAGMSINFVLAIIFCEIGAALGRWMRRVQR